MKNTCSEANSLGVPYFGRRRVYSQKRGRVFRALTGSFPELNFTAFRSDASPTDIVNALNSPPVLSDKRAVTVAILPATQNR
ncbi:MAG: hypothetical protein ACLUSP_09035 [Christensenellales bacterium]